MVILKKQNSSVSKKDQFFKKMGISTGFYWFFLSFTVHTLGSVYKIKLKKFRTQYLKLLLLNVIEMLLT